MKNIFQTSCILLLLTLFFYTCEKWDLEKEDFLSIDLNDMEVLSLNAVKLTGQIKGLTDGQISDHGFIWTSQSTTPTFYEYEGIEIFGIINPGNETSFSADIKDLDPDTRYTFIAFALLDGVFFYSDSLVWESGKGMIFTDSLSYTGGRSLEVFGHISGTETGIVGVNHGFCWSSQNQTPSLLDETLELGNQRSDEQFKAMVEDLEFETPLYLRAFAVLRHPITFELDTVYGEVISFDGELFDAWMERADFGGGDRSSVVGFSINGKGYIGTGDDANSSNFFLFKDFWEYDPASDTWTQRADFGGVARRSAVGFSINDKGYIGTGEGLDSELLKDFWEYDPGTNMWIQRADFGGEARRWAVGLSINDKGYIGTGALDVTSSTNDAKDFWEYDPQSDNWTQRADFGGEARVLPVGFSINDKGYIGTGAISGFEEVKDFWEYDPQSNNWTQRADFGGEGRYAAVGFPINDKGYIGTGAISGFEEVKDFWEYDPQLDVWKQKVDFEGAVRSFAFGFSINDKGFVGMGYGGEIDRIKDFWEYKSQ